jgi:hypothetical protein
MNTAAAEPLIGVINAGSSSLKFSFYEGERRILTGQVDGIVDTTIGRHIGVSLCHFALHIDGVTHRIDDAGEFEQQAVAHRFDDAAALFLYFGVGQLASERLQPCKHSLLVGAHEPAVTRDISGQNSSQPAFDAFCGHSGTPHRMGEAIIGSRAMLTPWAGAGMPFPMDGPLSKTGARGYPAPGPTFP